MPDANCAFPGCIVSIYKLHEGTTIFSITKRKSEFYQEWRKEILGILLKYRNIDLVLKEKLQNGDADFFICERHFTSDDIEYTAKYFLVFFLDICFTGT